VNLTLIFWWVKGSQATTTSREVQLHHTVSTLQKSNLQTRLS